MIDKVVEAVREDLLKRSQLGINKYKTTLDISKAELKEWLQHAYEECLDQANYLKRAILEIEEKERLKILNKMMEDDQRDGLYNY